MLLHLPFSRLTLLGLLAFATLARTGGLVNLDAAVQLARQMTAAR